MHVGRTVPVLRRSKQEAVIRCGWSAARHCCRIAHQSAATDDWDDTDRIQSTEKRVKRIAGFSIQDRKETEKRQKIHQKDDGKLVVSPVNVSYFQRSLAA